MIKDVIIQKKRYKECRCITVLLVLCVMLSGCTWEGRDKASDPGLSKTVKYTLHIGLNDKDTYRQEISDEKAMQVVTGTSLKYTDGFTIYRCQGMYKDAKGEVTKENSLVMEFYGAEGEKIQRIIDELLVSLNQESILMEKGNVTYRFYSKEGGEK